MTVSGVTVSSPDETRFLARNDPRNFLNREPILELELLLLEDNEGVRMGIVSTLVVVETSVGVDILLVSTRLRTEVVCFKLSPKLVLDGSLLSAIMAASVFCWTSLASSACSCGVWGILGVDGFLRSRYGDVKDGVDGESEAREGVGGTEEGAGGIIGAVGIVVVAGVSWLVMTGCCSCCVSSGVSSLLSSSTPNKTCAKSRLRRV